LGIPGVEAPRIFRHSAHEGGKVVSLTHQPPLSPEKIRGTVNQETNFFVTKTPNFTVDVHETLQNFHNPDTETPCGASNEPHIGISLLQKRQGIP
jgi:hypothetical protein